MKNIQILALLFCMGLANACDYQDVNSGKITLGDYVNCKVQETHSNPLSFLDITGAGGVCVETDGGNNPQQYGVVTSTAGINFPDMCCSGITQTCQVGDLDEFNCEATGWTGIVHMRIKCAYGCAGGACNLAPAQVTTTTLPARPITCESVGYLSTLPAGFTAVNIDQGTVVGSTCTRIYQLGLTCYGKCITVATTTIAPVTTLPVQKTCEDLGMLRDQPAGLLCSGDFYLEARQLCWKSCKTAPTTTTTLGTTATTFHGPIIGGCGGTMMGCQPSFWSDPLGWFWYYIKVLLGQRGV